MVDLDEILNEVYREVKEYIGKGKVADYIPELAKIDPNQFGMAVRLRSGEEYFIGDAAVPFSIQSISKLLTLTMYIQHVGLELGDRVGVEPSGNPFNSLIQLEYEHGIPRNPFINAGALVITDGLISIHPDIKEEVLQIARRLSGNSSVEYDLKVARSEAETGFRNAALVNFMKSYGNIFNSIEDVLSAYYHHCSLSMSCLDLVRMFSFLSNEGCDKFGEEVLSYRETKRVNALMMTCGTYDAVGDFAFKVGIPAKSGVGGGIVGVIPGVMTLATWSPALNLQGNSLAGTKAMETFTTLSGRSVF
ncbi:MAG TPA: glutaminase [Bacteroidales bacterium]|nr:glutaminase [Bacteroidales bacterium]